VPNTRSAAKQVRVQERRRLRNQSVRSATRTFVRKAQEAIQGGETSAIADPIREALSALDRAAKKGVIHPNNAARRKSRLMKKLNGAANSEA
jgi:small subunit ribosomal protein S20